MFDFFKVMFSVDLQLFDWQPFGTFQGIPEVAIAVDHVTVAFVSIEYEFVI
jgi:hypothetical protein